MLLVALAGAAPLVGASFVEGCGSAPRAADGSTQLDGAAQDANVDSGDAAPDSDADVLPGPCLVVPDAGYFITIKGDGAEQTLRSNSSPYVFHDVAPSVPWAVVYFEQGLAIGGSESPDGGASMQFDIEIKEDADGGVTLFGPNSGYSDAKYTRHDGTLFSSSALAAAVTLTEADPPGGILAGCYTVTVVDSTQPDASSLSLSGTFVTRRLPDSGGPIPPHHK
jgi:hypothetical protein